MKLLDQNPKEYFDKIIDTEPKNRPWVLSVVINFILFFGLCFMVYLYDEARVERMNAEKKYEVLVQLNLKENKDCSTQIREAEKARDIYWDNIVTVKDNTLNKLVNQRAAELENEVKRLRQQTNNLIIRTNKINNK